MKNNKKYFLFNPAWIIVIMLIAFVIGIFADIIEKPGRSAHFISPGFAIYGLTFIGIYSLYVWCFLGKLARTLPEKQSEVLYVRKCHLLSLKKHKQILDSKNITLRNTATYFLEGKEEFQWIDDEWQLGIKIFIGVTISVFSFYLFELVISGWMEATRPIILDYLSSIGLVK